MNQLPTMRVCAFALTLVLGLAARAQQTPEFRALWADTFHAGMRTNNEVSALVNTARAGNFNAIIVEVRKRGDAYYNSTVEPRASDVAAGFDPLADLIQKAHTGGRRIEVHAWITTYLIWNNQSTPPAQTNHAYNLHPEWLSRNSSGATWDGGNYQFDQSLPEVQKHVFNVAMDIVSRYDVDGFHFDYVRFSGNTWGYHSNALERFRRRFNQTGTPAPTDPQWLQFRRDQVSDLVRKVYLNAIALKPQVKISAATICFAPGITNDAGWFSSSAAWNNVLQDWRGWLQEGTLDLAVPMMYFDHRRYSNDWSRWSIFAKEHQYSRQVALGQGSYLNTLSNMIFQLRTSRVPTAASNAVPAGVAIYSYAVPVTNDTSAATAFNALVNPSGYDPNPVPVFENPVDPPIMTWKTAPTLGYLKGTIRAALTSVELDGAIVTIAGPMNAGRTNDATGFYGFANLTPGIYTVTASYSNLASQSAQVMISTGAVATLDFALSPTNTTLLNLRVFPGEREALVAWTTTNASDSAVEWGLTPALGNVGWRDITLVTNHVALITGLRPNTNYFFRAMSRGAGGTNSSEIETFRTAGAIVIDNGNAALAGSWSQGTASPDKFGADYRFATVSASAATATYTPLIATPGVYDVFVWYPQGANRSTNAPWLLAFNGGIVTGAVDQTMGGGAWRLVAAAKPLARGTSGYFQWSNQGGDAGKVVMADAVRFVYAANQEPPPENQVPWWWSDFFFGGATDATFDHDSDGFTTAEEYLAGSEPTRMGSRLRFVMQRVGDTLRLSFHPRHEGRMTRLDELPAIDSEWMPAGVSPTWNPGGEGLFVITNLGGAQKFYRLRVQL